MQDNLGITKQQSFLAKMQYTNVSSPKDANALSRRDVKKNNPATKASRKNKNFKTSKFQGFKVLRF